MDAETDAIGNKELRELQAGGRHVVKAGPGGKKNWGSKMLERVPRNDMEIWKPERAI